MSAAQPPQTSCTGYELVTEVVTGIRTWRPTPTGQLVGAAGHPWTPGEETAVCNKELRDAHLGAVALHMLTGQRQAGCNRDCCAGRDPDVHDPATCCCGFYAFHDGISDFGDDTWVVGVIRGYGRTSIGARGFRSQKAQIVALAFPDPAPPVPGAATSALLAVAAAAASASGVEWRRRNLVAAVANAVSAAVFLLTAASTYQVEASGRRRHVQPPDVAERVAAFYPGVPTYGSVEAMLAAHPLDAPPAPAADQDHPDYTAATTGDEEGSW